MYRGDRADFIYTVSRDFVRQCQTPVLVLPDDVPGHPYIAAMESVYLAPNAQVTLYPWKANPSRSRSRFGTYAGSLGITARPRRCSRSLPPPSSDAEGDNEHQVLEKQLQKLSAEGDNTSEQWAAELKVLRELVSIT
jgi:hypothetical protein